MRSKSHGHGGVNLSATHVGTPRAPARCAMAVSDVESNEALHSILNEWADIIPAEFDVYPLVDIEATRKMLAAQVAANKGA